MMKRRPPPRSKSSSGITIFTRSRLPSMAAVDSTVSCMHLSATQAPVKRDIAHQRQHAAVFRGAGEIGVAKDVAGAIDAGALAVPHGKDAIVLAFAAQLGLLRAPDGGRGHVLVDAGLKLDVVALKPLLRALELGVERAERRAAIAADIARGIEAGAAVALLLHQAQPHQRLKAGHEHRTFFQII